MTASTLPERLAHLVRAEAPPRAQSGSPAEIELSLTAPTRRMRSIEAIKALTFCHVPLIQAKRAVEEAMVGGTATLTVPCVPDMAALADQMTAACFRLTIITPPASVDVPAIRRATGMTQEVFARRFGLDLATLRKWEAGRSRPETAVRSYLALIGKDWQGVLRLAGR